MSALTPRRTVGCRDGALACELQASLAQPACWRRPCRSVMQARELTAAPCFGIPLAVGKAKLYAAYTASNTIVVWRVIWNGTNCVLTFHTQVPAVGLQSGSVDGMSESPNSRTLVVAYADGSVQSFTTAGLNVTPDCPTAINSTGAIDGNEGIPAGVDITADSRYAIFGDAGGFTELETATLPIACTTVTTDFGGIIMASGSNLGRGGSANNIWLSPNGRFIYVADSTSEQITTVKYNENLNTMSLAGGCLPPHTNPTRLKPLTWGYNAGIQTATTTGNGGRLFVAEIGSPSSVALLGIDLHGCTVEAPLSPFTDGSSPGALSLNAYPPRPF